MFLLSFEIQALRQDLNLRPARWGLLYQLSYSETSVFLVLRGRHPALWLFVSRSMT